MKQKMIIGIIVVCMVITAGVYAGLTYINIKQNPFDFQPKQPGKKDNYSINESNNNNLSNLMNDFALKLYKELSSKTNESVFFSPYSIYVALAMVFEGARTTNAEEMSGLLGYQQGNESMLNALYYLWQQYNNNTAFNLSTANALWLKNDFKILDEFVQKITKYFAGKTTEVDFSNAVEAAKIINDWVEQQTNNKIKDLVPPSAINSFTRLILTNAIYFKGAWEFPFDKNLTQNQTFTISSQQTVQVPMMYLFNTTNYFNYTETETLQILELPYAGGNVSMLIILPKDKDLAHLEETLTPEQIKEWRVALYQTPVKIYFPRFKLETSYSLNEPLQKLGMVKAFTQTADFSGIAEGLYISQVLHKAFIEVNEEGTEAAAATAIIMETTSVGSGDEPVIPVFRADHPFLFIIQHKDTGNILFLGKIINPLKQNT